MNQDSKIVRFVANAIFDAVTLTLGKQGPVDFRCSLPSLSDKLFLLLLEGVNE